MYMDRRMENASVRLHLRIKHRCDRFYRCDMCFNNQIMVSQGRCHSPSHGVKPACTYARACVHARVCVCAAKLLACVAAEGLRSTDRCCRMRVPLSSFCLVALRITYVGMDLCVEM